MLEWRIYYGDGSTFSNEDGEPQFAPAMNVQVIVVKDTADTINNVGRRLWFGRDYYWWDDGEWIGGDHFGLYDYLQRPGWRRVLFGRSVPARRFIETRRKALADPDFPAYSGSEVVE